MISKSLPTVIVLAAGRSTRFRATSGGLDKLQAHLGTLSVREHTLAAVQASGLSFHVVEPAHTAHLDQPGMGDSIATGARACAQAAGWLVLPADLPLVQPATLRDVAGASAHGAGGHRGRLTQGLSAATLGASTLGRATFGNH